MEKPDNVEDWSGWNVAEWGALSFVSTHMVTSATASGAFAPLTGPPK